MGSFLIPTKLVCIVTFLGKHHLISQVGLDLLTVIHLRPIILWLLYARRLVLLIRVGATQGQSVRCSSLYPLYSAYYQHIIDI